MLILTILEHMWDVDVKPKGLSDLNGLIEPGPHRLCLVRGELTLVKLAESPENSLRIPVSKKKYYFHNV